MTALKEVRRRTVTAYVEAVHPEWNVTLDVDAQLIETTKENAQYGYEGYKAFGSAKVCWAETMLVLADELRPGNVPPSKDISRLVGEAFESCHLVPGG